MPYSGSIASSSSSEYIGGERVRGHVEGADDETGGAGGPDEDDGRNVQGRFSRGVRKVFGFGL